MDVRESGWVATRCSWRGEFGDAFAGRVVLVTGATGFLGSNLCDDLLALGAETHGLARSAGGNRTDSGYVHWSVDITDAGAVRATIARIRPQIVYHFAGLSSARGDRELVGHTLQTNLCGTIHVLQALAETGCERVALACSAEEARGPTSDSAVASPYGAAKTAASVYGRLFHRLYGVPVVLVRPILAYGPRQDSTKLIPYVITSLLRNETPQLSSGARLCDFVYVTDVVRGFLMAGIAPNIGGASIDLGWGQSIRVRDVVDLLVTLTRSSVRPAFGTRPDRIEDPMGTADREAARSLLGWDPLWSLEAGLAETIDWCKRELKIADTAR